MFRAVFTESGFWKGAGPWIVLLLLLSNFGAAAWRTSLKRTREANLLADLSHLSERGDTRAPRYDWSVGENLAAYLPFVPDARTAPLVIVSGMSQMFSINDPKPGDETISEVLDDELSLSGIRVFGLAAPNLNNEEVILLLLSTLSSPSTRPTVFLYGVCFDKFRNIDLRPEYSRYLEQTPAVRALWGRTCVEFGSKYPLVCQKMQQTLNESLRAVTEPNDFEHALRRRAEVLFPLVAAKADLNAAIQMDAFLFRNWLLNIKPTSKRPIIAARYRLNQDFLGLAVDLSRQNGVNLVLYVSPLNPLAENPYVPKEYEEFKAWLAEFALKRGVPFANLEAAVPAVRWGERDGSPDFKHFTGEGHRLTAAAILKAFRPAIESAVTKRASR